MIRNVALPQSLQNPFSTVDNLRNSDYCAYVDGHLVHVLSEQPVSARTRLVHKALRSFIGSPRYPCVGAKSILNRSTYRFGCYRKLAASDATAGLARDLCAFAMEMRPSRNTFSSFIAVFDDGMNGEDVPFERALWRQLGRLRLLDRRFFAYDSSVSSDPENAEYAFSFASYAMFVVGLHPTSPRLARRFAWPALIFNPHEQFRGLRASGKYDSFKRVIRDREMSLQGTLNPNLSDFGEKSEARQYSGAPVNEEWKCPFRP